MSSPEWKVDVSGLEQVRDDMKAGARDGAEAAGRTMLDRSQAVVPVDTGELRGSGRVDVAGDVVTLSYSDSKAVAAHEDLRGRNRTGQAKFLEQPMTAGGPAVEAEMAAAIRGRLGG